MYTLPNFCRVCLKYDKNLIDLEHIENEPNETLMSKLQHCVAEVEWKEFKPLLCHPCIKRLNIAYSFNKQCVQSASMLKSYVALVAKSKEDGNTTGDVTTQSSAYMMLPNQKYIKIVVGSGAQNSNVFLNVVPTAGSSDNNNQNVIVKITKPESAEKNLSLNELLTESKSEELSVEIDPTDFGLGDECNSEDDDEDDEDSMQDWEDIISAVKIKPNGAANGKSDKNTYTHFVPILPKQDNKMDFSNSGEHFLSSRLFTPMEFSCESCEKNFTSKMLLRQHFKNFHMGKAPFKCDFCYTEFLVRSEYEACYSVHKNLKDPLELTLKDFKKDDSNEEESGTGDLSCDVCHAIFNNQSGLLRHKVRKHNQKNRKKYFIKGMKNAKCDICNRDFSTQSYMQLHRKLHLRDDIGYKFKVFGRHRYGKGIEGKSKIKSDDSVKDQAIKEESNSENGSDN